MDYIYNVFISMLPVMRVLLFFCLFMGISYFTVFELCTGKEKYKNFFEGFHKGCVSASLIVIVALIGYGLISGIVSHGNTPKGNDRPEVTVERFQWKSDEGKDSSPIVKKMEPIDRAESDKIRQEKFDNAVKWKQ